jgi:hypothetical protein
MSDSALDGSGGVLNVVRGRGLIFGKKDIPEFLD